MIVSKYVFSKCGNVTKTVQLYSHNFETVQYIIFTDKFSPFFQESNGNIYTTVIYKDYIFPIDENGKIFDGFSVDGKKVNIVNPDTKENMFADLYEKNLTLKKSRDIFTVTEY